MSNSKKHHNNSYHVHNVYTKKQHPNFIHVPKYPKCGLQQDWGMLNNRCVAAVPESNDFGQFIDINHATSRNKYKVEQNQTEPEKVIVKKSIMGSCPKLVTTNDAVTSVTNMWHYIDNVADIDKVMHMNQDNVYISETPRLKVIAYKYLKYKKNGVEVRKLQRKIVCLEYDIYRETDLLSPSKKMRLFFAVKPVYSGGNGATGDGWSHGLNIETNKSKTFVTKEVEIIDKQIPGNQSYLNDLQKVLLLRKETNHEKDSAKLNLNTLYYIAQQNENKNIHQNPPDSIFNKNVLQGIKELILKKCDSNLDGICKKQMNEQPREEASSKKCLSSSSSFKTTDVHFCT